MHYTELYLQSQVDYWKEKVERVRELCESKDGFPVAILAEDVLKALEDKRD